MKYDVLIIGAGPAGLTAAIYCRRAGKSVLVLEKETFGGQITHSPKVENYPGTIEMSGSDFGEKMVDQALKLGAEIELDRVASLTRGDLCFRAQGEYAAYEATSVIIAAGSRHRLLGASREEELTGHGVCYCAVCDGAFYKGKKVAVIGGGNSALQDAVFLAGIGCEVTLVQNLDFFTGEPTLLHQLRKNERVQFITGVVVKELLGGDTLTGIVIEKTATEETTELSCDAIFVAIGQEPENGVFGEMVTLNEAGYIQADESCTTGCDGVFVAGDCRTKKIRQIVTAASDGATAAVGACRYVDAIKQTKE